MGAKRADKRTTDELVSGGWSGGNLQEETDEE